MYQKIKPYIPYIISLVILLTFYKCSDNNKKELKDLQKAWKYKEMMYENNSTTLVRKQLEDGKTITSQQALLVTADTEKEMLLIENRDLKNTTSETRIITKTHIDSFFIPIETVEVVNNEGKTQSKQIFRVNNEWYGVNGTILDKGVMIDSIYFNNELVVTIGEKSNGLFKKNTPVVEVINKNPHSSTAEMYNVIITPKPKKFYEKRGFQMGMSAVVGTVVGIQLMK